MSGSTKEHTLGDVLLRMGAISADQLDSALALQSKSAEELLGNILIAAKVCTATQVGQAIEAQQKLRSSRLSEQALGSMAVAETRKRIMRNANLDMITHGARALKRVRGDDFTPVLGVPVIRGPK